MRALEEIWLHIGEWLGLTVFGGSVTVGIFVRWLLSLASRHKLAREDDSIELARIASEERIALGICPRCGHPNEIDMLTTEKLTAVHERADEVLTERGGIPNLQPKRINHPTSF